MKSAEDQVENFNLKMFHLKFTIEPCRGVNLLKLNF